MLLAQSGTLDGATLNGDIDVGGTGFINLIITNGLTLNGTVQLDVNERITLSSDSQTIGGEAEIVLNGGFLSQSAGNATTFGPNVLIRGEGSFQNGNFGETIINQGTIRAGRSGKQLSINNPVFRNEGVLEIRKGAKIRISESLTSTVSAVVSIDIGGSAVSQFGRLEVTNAADLQGTLEINLVDAYEPVLDQELQIATFGSLSNPFTVATGSTLPNSLKFDLVYGATDLKLKAIPGP
jgi:hypothetical protein